MTPLIHRKQKILGNSLTFYNKIYRRIRRSHSGWSFKSKRRNALEILKMRGIGFKKITVNYEVTKNGIFVYSNREIKGKYQLT